MSLDPTARESNVRDSIKKYFIDNLYTTERIEMLFDKYAPSPDVRDFSVDRWVSVHFREIHVDAVSSAIIDVLPATRKDTEGFRLAQLRDTVMGYLTDTTDEYCRIPFYRSKASGAWDLLGSLLVHNIIESSQMEDLTQTKYKIITVYLKYVSKV